MTYVPKHLSFAPLSEAAKDEFVDVRNFVSRVAEDLIEAGSLTQTESDFPLLQALVSHEAMKHANYEAWVAVGVAFGDALMNYIPGLAWCMVTDQTGSYAALQYESKALSIAAPTMLWKRVEQGEAIDLLHIATELKEFIERSADEYGDA